MNRPRHIWTPADISILRSMSAQGYTPERIAKNWKTSRSAIIAKCRVLNIELSKHVRQNSRVSVNHKKTYIPMLAEPIHVEKTVSLFSRRADQCLWIIGDAKDQRCCGSKTKNGATYCQDHDKIAHREEASKATTQIRNPCVI
jgi:hypothetical protein